MIVRRSDSKRRFLFMLSASLPLKAAAKADDSVHLAIVVGIPSLALGLAAARLSRRRSTRRPRSARSGNCASPGIAAAGLCLPSRRAPAPVVGSGRLFAEIPRGAHRPRAHGPTGRGICRFKAPWPPQRRRAPPAGRALGKASAGRRPSRTGAQRRPGPPRARAKAAGPWPGLAPGPSRPGRGPVRAGVEGGLRRGDGGSARARHGPARVRGEIAAMNGTATAAGCPAAARDAGVRQAHAPAPVLTRPPFSQTAIRRPV